MAQWIARRTSNPEVVGSSPTGDVFCNSFENYDFSVHLDMHHGRAPWQSTVAEHRGRAPQQSITTEHHGRTPWQSTIAELRSEKSNCPIASKFDTDVKYQKLHAKTCQWLNKQPKGIRDAILVSLVSNLPRSAVSIEEHPCMVHMAHMVKSGQRKSNIIK